MKKIVTITTVSITVLTVAAVFLFMQPSAKSIDEGVQAVHKSADNYQRGMWDDGNPVIEHTVYLSDSISLDGDRHPIAVIIWGDAGIDGVILKDGRAVFINDGHARLCQPR